MEHVIVAGLIVLIGAAGVLLAAMGLTGAGPIEFLDRPVCWIVGHPAPGSRLLVPTTWNGHPAEVWRCSRCTLVVTVVTGVAR